MIDLETPTQVRLGKIADESSSEYHSQDCVSASKLRVFKRKPGGAALYYQRFISKSLKDEDTDAKVEGRALHTLVLEPEKFDAEFAIAPEGIDRRTTIGKAAWTAFEHTAQGKSILKREVANRLSGMAGMVHAHPAAQILFANGEAEVSWRVKAGGLKHLPPLQCRTDWFVAEGCELSDGRPCVVDVKTAATLEEDAFGNFHRGVEDHAYHMQAALYMAILGGLGIQCFDFFFVAVEKCAPFGVEVYKLRDRELKEGQDVAERLLINLDRCYARHEWPNTSPLVKELKLSPRYWARKSEEDFE